MVEAVKENRIYGFTGEVGKDGFLTPEQQIFLNQIQKRAANIGMDHLTQMKPGDLYPMIAMATGIGKGRIIHLALEEQMRQKPDSKVLIIAGTKLVLVSQTQEALLDYQADSRRLNNLVQAEENEELVEETTDIEEEEEELRRERSFLYTLGKYGKSDANAQIATIQTVQSKVNSKALNPNDYDLVIVDEVHNVGTKLRLDVVKQFKKVLGFTATAYRNSGKMKTPEQYGFIVVDSLTLPEAQENRLLPPLLGIQLDTKDLVDEIPTTATGAIDYNVLEKLLKGSPDLRPFIADRVASVITDPSGRRYKTVIACNFVWEAQELAQLLHNKGIKVGVAINKLAAKAIHTKEVPAVDSIERYKLPENSDRSIQVLVSPYVASEGFDAPFTEVLVWSSPTDSDLRYTQYTGRLARRNPGKAFGVIVDCLYQTSQYSWSYNMGMWMKGSVKQLENGLLYLGPEADIETLRNLPVVENFRKQADIKPIRNLEEERLLPIQEGDFVIKVQTTRNLFAGGSAKLKPIIDSVLKGLSEQDPSLVIKRRGTNNTVPIVTVVTNPDRFVQAMIEKGAKLKTRPTPFDPQTNIKISEPGIGSIFVGSYRNVILPIVEKVLNIIRQENPEQVIDKRDQSHPALVTNRERFIQLMIESGAVLNDKLPVQPTEFVLSQPNVARTFEGGNGAKIWRLIDIVVKDLQEKDVRLLDIRKNYSEEVRVVTDRDGFIQEMIKRGAKLKNE